MSGLFGQALSLTPEPCNEITGRTSLERQTQQSFNADLNPEQNTDRPCWGPSGSWPALPWGDPYQVAFSVPKFFSQLGEVLCNFAGYPLVLELCQDFTLQLLVGISSLLYPLPDGQQLVQVGSLVLKGGRADTGSQNCLRKGIQFRDSQGFVFHGLSSPSWSC